MLAVKRENFLNYSFSAIYAPRQPLWKNNNTLRSNGEKLKWEKYPFLFAEAMVCFTRTRKTLTFFAPVSRSNRIFAFNKKYLNSNSSPSSTFREGREFKIFSSLSHSFSSTLRPIRRGIKADEIYKRVLKLPFELLSIRFVYEILAPANRMKFKWISNKVEIDVMLG